jgi:hypothetical protein
MIAAIALWCAMQAAPASMPADVPLHVEKAPAEVAFGAPFELELTRTWKAGGPEPEWSDAWLSPLSIDSKTTERNRTGEDVVETIRVKARAFVVGEASIPALRLDLPVRSSLPEHAGPVEMPPGPFEKPFPWNRVLAVGAAAVAGLVALWALARWWRRRPRVATAVPLPPPIPPHDRALARLAALRALPVRGDDDVQKFYIEASAIVREYVEDRYKVRAPEMTTEEFLNSSLTARLLAPPHRALLSGYLNHCDLVKFARQDSSANDRDQLLSSAEKFVQETRIDLAREQNMSPGAPPENVTVRSLESAGARHE